MRWLVAVDGQGLGRSGGHQTTMIWRRLAGGVVGWSGFRSDPLWSFGEAVPIAAVGGHSANCGGHSSGVSQNSGRIGLSPTGCPRNPAGAANWVAR